MKTFHILILLLGIAYLGFLMNQPKPIQPQLPIHTMYDVVLECQKLSAVAGEKWGYKSCVDELGKTIKKGVELSI